MKIFLCTGYAEKEEKSGETAVALLEKRKCFKIYFAKIRKMQNVKLLK